MGTRAPDRPPTAACVAKPPSAGLAGYLDGSQPLWKAWLLYWLGSALLLGLLLLGLQSVLAELILFLERVFGVRPATTILLLGVPPIAGFLLFSLLALWRCAENTGWPAWTLLTRILVGLHVLWSLGQLLAIFF